MLFCHLLTSEVFEYLGFILAQIETASFYFRFLTKIKDIVESWNSFK